MQNRKFRRLFATVCALVVLTLATSAMAIPYPGPCPYQPDPCPRYPQPWFMDPYLPILQPTVVQPIVVQPVVPVQPVVVQPVKTYSNYYMTTGYVNIRSGPGTNYQVIGYVQAGQVVQKVGGSGGWIKIQTSVSGCDAYISASYATAYPYADAPQRVVYPVYAPQQVVVSPVYYEYPTYPTYPAYPSYPTTPVCGNAPYCW